MDRVHTGEEAGDPQCQFRDQVVLLALEFEIPARPGFGHVLGRGPEHLACPQGDGLEFITLGDADPHDYARAIRIFPPGKKLTIKCRLLFRQADRGRLEIDVLDAKGRAPIGIRLLKDGKIQSVKEARYEKGDNPPLVRKEKVDDLDFTYDPHVWLSLRFEIDAEADTYSLILNEKTVLKNAAFAEAGVDSLERLSFRTGKFRVIGKRSDTSRGSRGNDAIDPATDIPLKEEQAATYCIDDVFIVSASLSSPTKITSGS